MIAKCGIPAAMLFIETLHTTAGIHASPLPAAVPLGRPSQSGILPARMSASCLHRFDASLRRASMPGGVYI